VQHKQQDAKPKAPTAQRGRFGHLVGSMANALDDLLAKGTTREAAVAVLMRDFGRDAAHARTKFVGHVRYLPVHRGVAVSVSKDGTYKADKTTLGK
jgi:hypothetical protein